MQGRHRASVSFPRRPRGADRGESAEGAGGEGPVAAVADSAGGWVHWASSVLHTQEQLSCTGGRRDGVPSASPRRRGPPRDDGKGAGLQLALLLCVGFPAIRAQRLKSKEQVMERAKASN